MAIFKLYRKPAFTAAKTKEILQKLQKKNGNVEGLQTELCYYVELSGGELGERDQKVLKWVLQNPFEPENLTENENLKEKPGSVLIEVNNFSDLVLGLVTLPQLGYSQ